MGLNDWLGNNWITILLVTLTYVAVYVTAFRILVINKGKKIIEREKRFAKAVIEGLKTESIENLEDIINIYKGVIGSNEVDYQSAIGIELRKLLVNLFTNDDISISEIIPRDQIKLYKKKISEYIKGNETIAPYAGLPAAEKGILDDISEAIDKNQLDLIKRKFPELAGIIQARVYDVNRLRNINTWTVPLSFLGVATTIIFGITTIIR